METRKARDVLSKRLFVSCARHSSVTEAAGICRENGLGALAVVDEDKRIVGVFTERDALYRVCADGRNPSETSVMEVMTPEPTVAGEGEEVIVCIVEMFRKKIRNLPIVDGDGMALGIFSMTDATEEEMADAFCLLRLQHEIEERG